MNWTSGAVHLCVPPLRSGGLILTYRCSSMCRHCLFRCSPDREDRFIDLDTADRTLAVLSRERSLEGIHLAGGEATLKMDRLLAVIRLAVRRGVPLAYLETSGAWCTDREVALEGMRRLKEAGLHAIMISVSPYHNEFVPFHAMRIAIEAAQKVFRSRGALLFQARSYDMLAALPGDGCHSLAEQLEAWGLEDDPQGVLRVHPVVAGGRAVDGLRWAWPPVPARAFAGVDCYEELTSTTHFHLDLDGALFPGICSGLAVASIDNLHPEITPSTHPLFSCLATEGPFGLMRLATELHGYVERPSGYVSRCDLCLDVRRRLEATGSYPELRPAEFYMP